MRAEIRRLPACFSESWRRVVRSHKAQAVAVPTVELPNLASQIRTAFSSMVANTGSRSPGELTMTCSTSDVAVAAQLRRSVVRCRSSLSSRAFSMAMTA